MPTRTDTATRLPGPPIPCPRPDDGPLYAAEADEELGHLVRTLSHDLDANFSLLAASFGRLKESMGDRLRQELREGIAGVEAGLRQTQRLVDNLVLLGRTGHAPTPSQPAGDTGASGRRPIHSSQLHKTLSGRIRRAPGRPRVE